ncbi:Major facilitator superfamily [Seminavis robusta]|uniref:Major facilitator superfamily n=1 Tax=Seminavis robusta TaxID=568900 RepID=A0A9N8HUY7_9STRA|nr:Major facilitator superfamily [Seminavis robusta]|eukprot:Sro1901_g304320.1 Major facilitator superfamily (552) ;mRNA; r:6723-8572
MDAASTGGETATSSSSMSAKKNRSRTETVSTVASSETQQLKNAAAAEDEAEALPRWFPICCGKPILHGKPEALGFLLGMLGQVVGVLGVMTFVVPSLVYFAKKEAGCQVELEEGQDELPPCNETVYGIKPSSMITTLVSIVSICVALMTPVIGAIIDTSRHRRLIGRCIAFFYCCVILPQVFISENTWFPLVICLMLQGCTIMALSLCLHAYLPDLTDSEEELNDFTKTFTAVPGGFIIVFIIAVIGASVAFDVAGEEGPTARIAALFGVIVVAISLFISWGFLLKERPSLNALEEGQWRLTAGFKKIYLTAGRLYRTDMPLLWFFIAVALGDVKPLTGIGLTFLSSQQQFTSTDVGLAAIIMLVSAIPGAVLSAFMCRKFNPIRSSMLSLVIFSMTTIAASIFLTGPNQKPQTYVIVGCWGVVGGWKVTSTLMLVAGIIPEGGDAEYMGFYLFADSGLSWLPPLIFTAMNEAGMSERLGVSVSTVIWYVLGIGAYFMMGSYDDLIQRANRLEAPEKEHMAAISEHGDSPSKLSNSKLAIAISEEEALEEP